MFTTLKNAFKVKEIRNKIFITLGLLFIFRLGCWLPIFMRVAKAMLAQGIV